VKSLSVIAKALVAVIFATAGAASLKAGGADLSVLTAGDWMAALGAGLVSGGAVYGTPNKTPELAPTEVIATTVQSVIDARAQAQSDLEKVTAVLKDAAGQLPIYGPEAKAVLDSLPKF
jgi:hypothetical protein